MEMVKTDQERGPLQPPPARAVSANPAQQHDESNDDANFDRILAAQLAQHDSPQWQTLAADIRDARAKLTLLRDGTPKTVTDELHLDHDLTEERRLALKQYYEEALPSLEIEALKLFASEAHEEAEAAHGGTGVRPVPSTSLKPESAQARSAFPYDLQRGITLNKIHIGKGRNESFWSSDSQISLQPLKDWAAISGIKLPIGRMKLLNEPGPFAQLSNQPNGLHSQIGGQVDIVVVDRKHPNIQFKLTANESYDLLDRELSQALQLGGEYALGEDTSLVMFVGVDNAGNKSAGLGLKLSLPVK